MFSFRQTLLKLTKILLALYICLHAIANVYAQSIPKSYQIKAGFLLHFTSFVEWPDVDKPNLNICIIGNDPFGQFFDDMISVRPTNRSGKEIVITRLSVGQDVKACNIIFTTKSSTTAKFWKSLPKNHSILLVSEFDKFTRQGGLVNFYADNKRTRLEINLKAVEEANLRISSELLKLVKITRHDDSESDE